LSVAQGISLALLFNDEATAYLSTNVSRNVGLEAADELRNSSRVFIDLDAF